MARELALPSPQLSLAISKYRFSALPATVIEKEYVMIADRQEWRDRWTETAIDPDLPIIDPHHHLFPTAHRPKLEPYPAEALFADMRGSGHRFMATVHVDAYSNYWTDGPEHLRVVGETEYVDRVADDAERQGGAIAGACAAIVGNADLKLGGAVGEIIDAHLAASRRFRGVRLMTASDPDLPNTLPTPREAGVLGRANFRAGLAEVTRRQLCFDAAVVHSQLFEVVALARAAPDARIVLDHIGTPIGIGRYANRRRELFADWYKGAAELATCPNVSVKIGGLNMAFTGLGVADDAASPLSSSVMADRQGDFVRATIDLFGPARCMFASNFPVDKWYTSCTVLWNAFKLMSAGYNAAERAELFHGTARRVYDIDVPDPKLHRGALP